MSRFNTKVSLRTNAVNIAGGEAFALSPELELVHAVIATFLKDEFYEGANQRIDRIKKLVNMVDPIFVAKLALFARQKMHLRSVSHLLVGELAKIHRGDDLIKRAIVAVSERADDMSEIAAVMGLPMPKQGKRGIRNALLKFDRYALAKYKGDGKQFSIRNLIRLTRPKVQYATAEQAQAWSDLIMQKSMTADTWESSISGAEASEKTGEWERLLKENKLGYMALLRNLNNLIKNNVSGEVIDLAVKKLTDKEEVDKSKLLPFRFLSAYSAVSGNRKLVDAVSEAMDLAVSNVPVLTGKTLIAVDTSGSMSGDPITKAAPLAAALAKSNDADLIQYNTEVTEMRINSKTPVIDIAEKIKRDARGGGTATNVVFEWAQKNGKKYDRIIILSDNESWSGSAFNAYKKYRTVADPFVHAIDVQGYGTVDLKGHKVFHSAGWSDKVLDMIAMNEKGVGLIAQIEELVV